MSAIYFATFFAFSAVGPYLPLYYSSMHFNGVQIGVLLGIGPLISLFATPFWTGLADSRNRHRLALLGGLASLIAIYALFPFLASFEQILFAIIVLALVSSHVVPLQDSAIIYMLGGQRDLYGRLRAWGTVGWGLGAPLFGMLFNVFGLRLMFAAISITMLANLILVRKLEFQTTSQPIPAFTGLKQLFQSARWQLFFLTVFLAALGLSAHSAYLALLVDGLGPQGQTLFNLAIPAYAIVGIALALGTIVELPVMIFSKQLILALGDRGLFLGSLLALSIRNMSYAFSANALHVLLTQLLHGFTFALIWLGGINFVAKYAPNGMTSTTQGLFNTVLLGIGFAIGSLLNGYLIDIVGVGMMFGINAAMVFSGFLIVLILNKRVMAF